MRHASLFGTALTGLELGCSFWMLAIFLSARIVVSKVASGSDPAVSIPAWFGLLAGLSVAALAHKLVSPERRGLARAILALLATLVLLGGPLLFGLGIDEALLNETPVHFEGPV